MKPFVLNDALKAFNGQWSGIDPQILIERISIDSRSLDNGLNTLFFALTGANFDAHNYIEELIDAGVMHFVVTHIPDAVKGQAQFIVVPDVLQALQNLAAWYRQQFDLPVIAVTGSNGKTIVKEWLNFLLSPNYNIIRSPKSYNSQVGVPLSLFGIQDKHNLGIFEAGISTTGEMERLEAIIQPKFGIMTNIGSAHDEGFSNLGEKIKEKLKLFQGVDWMVYCKNKTIDTFIPSSIRKISWSTSDVTADIFLERTDLTDHDCAYRVHYKNDQFELRLPFQDESSVENALHCLCVLLLFDVPKALIVNRMALLYPVEMRLSVKKGQHNCTLIDDSYSSDFQSLKIALDFLENQSAHRKKTLILSDIFQSGLAGEELYSRVSQFVITNKINRVLCVGEGIGAFAHKFVNAKAFKTTSDLLQALDQFDFENETILIKGARHFRFEKIVAALEEKTHETVLEINLNAISDNLNYYRSKLQKSTKLMVMVKAYGYGNGGFEIARLLEHHSVDYLGVAFTDEGIELKAAGITIPIIVMNPETTSYAQLIQYGLEPEIYNMRTLNGFIRLLKERKIKQYPIHIKLDTGMHRLGFERAQLDDLIATLRDCPWVEVKSVFSHLATSDMPEQHDFVMQQIAVFDTNYRYLCEQLQIKPIAHILNTAGISNYGFAQYDMVRLGLGLYGLSADEHEQTELAQVGTLKSVISQIKQIKVGDSVGYGRRFVAQRPTVTATVPIGYADGILRKWGNGVGYVVINGKKAPIVGSICMDMLMCDVTGITCKEGDEVILFGEHPSLTEIATILETIPYEIMTSISNRVKRVFYRS